MAAPARKSCAAAPCGGEAEEESHSRVEPRPRVVCLRRAVAGQSRARDARPQHRGCGKSRCCHTSTCKCPIHGAARVAPRPGAWRHGPPPPAATAPPPHNSSRSALHLRASVVLLRSGHARGEAAAAVLAAQGRRHWREVCVRQRVQRRIPHAAVHAVRPCGVRRHVSRGVGRRRRGAIRRMRRVPECAGNCPSGMTV